MKSEASCVPLTAVPQSSSTVMKVAQVQGNMKKADDAKNCNGVKLAQYKSSHIKTDGTLSFLRLLKTDLSVYSSASRSSYITVNSLFGFSLKQRTSVSHTYIVFCLFYAYFVAAVKLLSTVGRKLHIFSAWKAKTA